MVRKARQTRSGTTAVEFACVVPVVLMILLGIFEFGRLIFVQQLTENAARTGARYAVVNTNDTNLVADTQAVTTAAMCGFQSQLGGFSVGVFLSNSSGQNLGDPTTAAFGQYIGVNVSGNYDASPTSMLGIASSIPISVTSIMTSEAN